MQEIFLELRLVNPAQNRFRAFAAHLTTDLFGDVVLETVRGRIGTPGGQSVREVFSSFNVAERRLAEHLKAREGALSRHGARYDLFAWRELLDPAA